MEQTYTLKIKDDAEQRTGGPARQTVATALKDFLAVWKHCAV